MSLRLLSAFVRRDFQIAASYPANFFLVGIGGLFSLTLFYFLAKTVGQPFFQQLGQAGNHCRTCPDDGVALQNCVADERGSRFNAMVMALVMRFVIQGLLRFCRPGGQPPGADSRLR